MTTSTISPGQTSTGLDITSGNTLVVANGGFASATTIETGGCETVLGSAAQDQIHGIEMLSAATAIANADTVFQGGALDLFLAGTVASNTVVNGGSIVISGRGDAIDTTLDGGTIFLESPKATLSGSLVFAGSATVALTTVISGPSGGSAFGDQAIISGFGQGDVIDLMVVSGGTLTFTTSGSELEAVMSGASVPQTFLFSGITSNFLSATADGSGGTEIVYTACYAAGTSIRTGRGEVAVEDLAAGDLVESALGRGMRPVRWIGHARLDPRRIVNPAMAHPIRIVAGAFSAGVPTRDLRLSPEHAVLIDDVLIPVRHLVNGTTIVQEPVDMIEYFHIELESHDAVYAEGLGAETWLDTGNRWMFDNAGVTAMTPFFLCTPGALACAPVVECGPELEVVRRRLALQAAAIGRPPAAGVAVPLAAGTVTARVPAGAGLIRLLSAVNRNATDRRPLGAAVAAIDLGGVAIPLDDEALTIGWYGPETEAGATWRWTDGAALLNVMPAPFERQLRVRVAAVSEAAAA